MYSYELEDWSRSPLSSHTELSSSSEDPSGVPLSDSKLSSQVRYFELPECVESNSSVSVFELVDSDDYGSTSESVVLSDSESVTNILFLVTNTLKHGISVASSS